MVPGPLDIQGPGTTDWVARTRGDLVADERAGPETVLVLADGRRAHREPLEPSRRILVRFAVSTGLALAVILVTGLVFANRAAEREGVADVRELTAVLARNVVEPNLPQGLLEGDRAAITTFDALVTQRLQRGTDIVRVKLWSPDGRIVYSDDPRLIGARFAIDAEERAVLTSGGTEAEVSDLSRPENRLDRSLGPHLLEVYTGVRTARGDPLLLECYYSFADVNSRRTELMWSFASITLAGLVVFAGFQISLGYNTVSWLQRERERLLSQAVKVSEAERRRLAADLHDGVVQDLVGASFVVSGAAQELERGGSGALAARLKGSTEGIRASIQRLRSMVVDLYPASLRQAGLDVALSDLVAPLRARDVDVELIIDPDLDLPEHAESLLYRVAQESLRNVSHHARATRVRVRVTSSATSTTIEVVDDGVGFVPRPAQPGHIGLRTIADLAEESGALLQLSSSPGRGTTVRLELPR